MTREQMEGIMMGNVDKEEIKSAIKEINGVIMDFTDAVDSLTGVKNLLYKLLENEKVLVHGHCHCPDSTDLPLHKRCPYCKLGGILS
jgi:hypothetical protein